MAVGSGGLIVMVLGWGMDKYNIVPPKAIEMITAKNAPMVNFDEGGDDTFISFA